MRLVGTLLLPVSARFYFLTTHTGYERIYLFSGDINYKWGLYFILSL